MYLNKIIRSLKFSAHYTNGFLYLPLHFTFLLFYPDSAKKLSYSICQRRINGTFIPD